jgi:hypothetical protein
MKRDLRVLAATGLSLLVMAAAEAAFAEMCFSTEAGPHP